MYVKRLLLSIFLLSFINGAATDPTYLLTIPALLVANDTGNVCLNIISNKQSLHATIQLQYDFENITILDEEAIVSNFFQCNTFNVPSVETNTPVFVYMVISGEDYNIEKRKSVVIQPFGDNTYAQFDKPLYQLGDLVMSPKYCRKAGVLNGLVIPENQVMVILNKMFFFRSEIPCVLSQSQAAASEQDDEGLFAVSMSGPLSLREHYAVIYITDPSGNRLAQWLDQTLKHGILEFQFQLGDDAAPGYYTIYSETETSEYSNYIQSFPVQEYVIPRFEVNVIVPNAISVLDINFLFEVFVLYTYGDPVPGVVTARICRSPEYRYGPKSNCFYNIDICHDITGAQIGPNGTFSSVVDLHQFHINLQGFQMGLSVELTVVEAGTGVQVKEYRYIYISSQLANVRFLYESMDTYYRHGLPYPVGVPHSDISITFHLQVSLTNEKNEPIPNQPINLSFNDEFLVTLTTDSSGIAGYLIDTNNYIQPNFNLTATYENPDQCYYLSYSNEQYPTDRHQVLRFYSETGSFVQIHQLLGELSCGQSYSVDVQYILTREGVGEASTITFYTMIMSKLLLVQHASHDVDLTTSLTGTFSVEISVSDQLAPTATLIVYCIFDTEIIAHTITLNIEKCFRNELSKRVRGRGQRASLPGAIGDGEFCRQGPIDHHMCGPSVVQAPDGVQSYIKVSLNDQHPLSKLCRARGKEIYTASD
ncbi:Hypothetical predicted protein [Pelobates cultripes]|uniref:Alpha-2-macroglobulin bait region domain-containing protein n=1 Tax=Pelobates cultripes TaxID=61616 RepID=A0AAD1TEN7_PELCU|nr:Hypothetical predicted protein [Pelobates cultripes]